MGIAREVVARVLVVLAVAVSAIALGAWWSSLLVARTADTLGSVAHTRAVEQINRQLDALSPGASQSPAVRQAVDRALGDPRVAQALAGSAPGGSKVLSSKLTQLDGGLTGVLGGRSLNVDVGQHALVRLASRLRSAALTALIAAATAGVGALALSPVRHLVLRHLALGIGGLAALALLTAWALPAAVGRFTHGTVHQVAASILSGGDPVRNVLVACLCGGVVAYLATHAFELVGGRAFRAEVNAPLPEGRVV